MTPVALSAGRRLGGAVELPLGPCEELLGSLCDAPPAGIGERRPDRLDGGRSPVARDEVGGALVAEHGVDRRQSSQRVIGHGAILRPHVPRQRRPTLYAMQSFGRRQRPRRLPPVRPLAAIAVVVVLGTARHGGVRDPPPVAADRPRRRCHRRPGRCRAAGGAGRRRLRRSSSSPGRGRAARRASAPAPRSSSTARPGACCGRRTHTGRLPVASLTKLMTALVAADAEARRVVPGDAGDDGRARLHARPSAPATG